MNEKFSGLLSPLKIGNVVLKSRLCFPNASPHFLQGPETWPADGFMALYSGLARNGAAYINLGEWNNPMQRRIGAADGLRMQSFDTTDPSTTNYLSALADEIHFYGSKLCVCAMPKWPEGYSYSGGFPLFSLPGVPKVETKAAPKEMLEQVCIDFAEHLKMYKTCGYDMVSFHINDYLNPFTNKRTDEYGCQTKENAARFLKLLSTKIKETLGKDWLIECSIHGEEHRAFSSQDVVEFLKELEGYIDIVSLREKDAPLNHPTGYNFKENVFPCVQYARAIKASGNTMKVALNGGFQNPVVSNRYIVDGTADLICQARGFFADFDYMKKINEDRAEDITPCVLCNKCHGTMEGPWISVCTVNPFFGMQQKVARLTPPPAGKKKVAIIGGGPTGMRAAMDCADRGHKVTIFEKADKLGGQLFHSDYVSFKWPLKRYKDWLIKQLEKRPSIEVVLNCAPTPEMIKAGGFDAVIAATGAVPNIPDVEGMRGPDGKLAEGLFTCLDVFGKEDKLGQKVVVVGGSETGIETAMHLAEKGRTVHVLTRQNEIAPDAGKLHGITMAYAENAEDGSEIMFAAWELYGDKLTWTLEAETVKVSPSQVVYRDKDGGEHVIDADSVVISGGMKSLTDEALKYSGIANQFFLVGDCEKPTNIQVNTRRAYGAAVQI